MSTEIQLNSYYANPLGYLRGLYAQTVSSTPITNTILESDVISTGVGSLSIPANGFKVGDSFHAKLIGHLSCNSSATIRFRIKAGTIILADTGVVALDDPDKAAEQAPVAVLPTPHLTVEHVPDPRTIILLSDAILHILVISNLCFYFCTSYLQCGFNVICWRWFSEFGCW